MTVEQNRMRPVRDALSALGEDLGAEQAEHLLRYHDLLVTSNSRYSVVSAHDVPRILDRHFVESVQLLRWIPRGPISIVDIGSGGGLPGIVIRLLRPDAAVVLLERRRRKQVFLRFAVNRLALTNTSVFANIVELADASAGAPAKRFDRVLARAVGSLAELLPLAASLMTPGGLLIAPKGSRVDDDLAAATGTLRETGFILAERRAESLTSAESGLIHGATLVFRRRAAD